MKKWLLFCLSLLLVVTVTGCGMFSDPKTADPKDFTLEGLTITLTDAFRNLGVEGATGGYQSKDCALFLIKEPFDLLENGDELTLEEYVERVKTKNGIDVEIKTEENLTYFERAASADGVEFGYYSVMYRAPDAFWLLQFTCEKKDYEEYRPYFVNWAKSVTFDAA